jgi:hypothetical protein
MDETKPFWASRTIWVGIVGVLFPLLAAAGWLPRDLSEEQVVDGLMALLGLLTILFRARATSLVAGSAGEIRR